MMGSLGPSKQQQQASLGGTGTQVGRQGWLAATPTSPGAARGQPWGRGVGGQEVAGAPRVVAQPQERA
jgi:hypothetical protein